MLPDPDRNPLVSGVAGTISVALASYEGERHLGQQLASLARQTRLPDELVVADDASRDRTLQILRDFADSAPFPVSIYPGDTNRGYVANFSRAIEHTRGALVFLSDQDDVWDERKLERMEAFFNSDSEALLVVHDVELTDAELVPSGVTQMDQASGSRGLIENYVPGACSAFRWEILPLLLPIPEVGVTHDAWLHAIGAILGRRRALPEVLQFHRRHDRNASSSLASLARKPTRSERWRAVRDRDNAADCWSWSHALEILEERLRAVQDRAGAELNPLGDLDLAIGRAAALRAAHRARFELLSRRRSSRLLPALRMYAEGGYGHFNGARSLASDLLR
jgi:glycosyltransferase involved in cell wall biosynthesis